MTGKEASVDQNITKLIYNFKDDNHIATRYNADAEQNYETRSYTFHEDGHCVPGTMTLKPKTVVSVNTLLRVCIDTQLAIPDVPPSYQGKLHHLQQYLSQWVQSWDTRHKRKDEDVEPGH